MRVLREESAGLIIDIQERLFPHMSEPDHLIRNVPVLVKGLKILGIPVLVTQQYTRGLGPTIGPVSTVLEGTEILEKKYFSCCDEPGFMDALVPLGKKFIIIAGIEAHVCVLQTAIDLSAMGFVPVVVDDAVSSRKPGDKSTALERMRQEGILITSCESILFELTRHSGTDEFKTISQLIK